jgi:hypothetical protein
MIGYKAFDENLQCRGFQFEVGKTYETGKQKDELKLCTDTVFHFCRELYKIESVSGYTISKSRVCEVIAEGDIVTDGDKYGTNKLTILREIPREESRGDRYLPTYQRIRPYYDRAVDALERLVCLTDLVSDYDLLISVLQDRAFRAGEVVHRGAGDQHYLELELVDRLRILELCHVLYEKTGLEKYERDRDFLYYTVGDLYESLGDPEKAAEYRSKTTFDPWDRTDPSDDPKN